MTLPFPSEPKIRCYLHHAYATGILSAASRLQGCSHKYANLELRCGDRFSGEGSFLDFTPYVDIATLVGEAGLTVSDTTATQILALNESSLRENLVGHLRQGEYVLVYLDQYFAPWSSCHAQVHRPSQHLLLGFERDQFLGVNYRTDSSFGPCPLAPEMLWRGLIHQARIADPLRNQKIIRTIRVESDSLPPERAEDRLINLNHFWNSDPSAGQGRERHYLYGEACYFSLTDEIRQLIDRRQVLDLRRTRLLCERLAMLTQLFQELLETKGETQAWEAEWQRVTALFQSVHLGAYHYNLKKTASVDIAALLDRAAEAEKQFFDRFVDPIGQEPTKSYEK